MARGQRGSESGKGPDRIMGKVTVSDILEQPGGWRFSVRILIFVGLAMVFDGFD